MIVRQSQRQGAYDYVTWVRYHRVCVMWLQADIVARTQVTSAQLWVLLLGQIVFLVWLLVLKKVQVWQRRHVNVTWPSPRTQLLLNSFRHAAYNSLTL